MTQYSVKYINNEAVLAVKGHSGYKEMGEDIVCAAISTACIMTANLIDKLGLGYNIKDLICKDGYFKLQVNTQDKLVVGIMDNMLDTLDSLSKQYPKHVKFKD